MIRTSVLQVSNPDLEKTNMDCGYLINNLDVYCLWSLGLCEDLWTAKVEKKKKQNSIYDKTVGSKSAPLPEN